MRTLTYFILSLSMVTALSGAQAFAVDATETNDVKAPDPKTHFAHETTKYDLKPDAAVRWGILDNGLKYGVISHARPSEQVSLRLWVNVGSLAEDEKTRGIAHFLEHIAFKSAKGREEKSALDLLESFGVAKGADSNAYTSFDRTVYQFDLPSNEKETVETAFSILRDIAGNAAILEDEVESERGVILSELRARNSPSNRYSQAVHNFLAPDALATKRFPIGTEESLNAITADNVRAFYQKYYRPDQMAIAVVGDLSEDELEAYIQSFFSDLTNDGDAPKEIDHDDLEITQNLKTTSFVDEGLFRSVSLFFSTQSPKDEDAKTEEDPVTQDPAADEASAELIEADDFVESDAGEANEQEPEDENTDDDEEGLEKLSPEAREEKRLGYRKEAIAYDLALAALRRRLSILLWDAEPGFSSAGIDSSSITAGPRFRRFGLNATGEDWQSAITVAGRELNRAFTHGFTEAELKEQRTRQETSYRVSIENWDNRTSANIANQLLSSITDHWVYRRPEDRQADFNAVIDDITIEDMQREFKDRWDDRTPKIFIAGSSDPGEIAETAANAWKAGLETQTAIWDRATADRFAYTDFGRPGRVTNRFSVDDLGITQLKLANNVAVNIKPTEFEKDRIYVQFQIGEGIKNLPSDKPGFWTMAQQMWLIGGLEAHSINDLQTILSDSGLALSPIIGGSGLALQGSVSSDKLDILIQLMTAFIAHPGFRPEAEALYNRNIRQQFDAFDANPDALLAIHGQRALYKNDARIALTAPTADTALSYNLTDAEALIRPLLSREYLEVTVVGDLDPVAVETIMLKTVGTLPQRNGAPETLQLVDDISFADAGSRLELTHTANDDRALVGIYWPLQGDVTPDEAADFVAVGRIAANRAFDDIREKLGDAYSPVAQAFGTDESDWGMLYAQSDASTENVAATEAELIASVRSILNGIEEDELQRAVEPIIKSQSRLLENNGFWQQSLSISQLRPDSLDAIRTLFTRFEAIDIPRIEAAAKRLIGESAPIVITVKAEDKKSALLSLDADTSVSKTPDAKITGDDF